MAKYEVGFGKPPESGQFRPGVSGNPKGRPKRKPSTYAERVVDLFDAPVTYRERGKTKVATRRELAYQMLVDKAVAGGAKEINQVLKMLRRAMRNANVGAVPIVVENWLPDHPGQTADQKGAEVDARKMFSSAERSRESKVD
jgi:hypothetical protein